MYKRLIAFSLLTLTLVSCNLFNPSPAPQQTPPQENNAETSSQATPEFISAKNQAAPTYWTRGITAQGSITLGGSTTLAGSLHSNQNLALTGTLNAAGISGTAGSMCIDSSNAQSCTNGKPKVQIAPLGIELPSYNTLADAYTPDSYDKTIQGNQIISSAAQLEGILGKAERVLIKGDVILDAPLNLKDTTLVVEGKLLVKGDLTLEGSILFANQMSMNGINSTINDSVIISSGALQFARFDGSWKSIGKSTIFASSNLEINAPLESKGQLSLQSKTVIKLNRGTVGVADVLVWGGSGVELLGNHQINGGIVSGGSFRSNGSLNLARADKVLNPDVTGFTPEINTTPASSTGTLVPGGTVVGPDGVSVTSPIGTSLDKPVEITIERVDPASITVNYNIHPLVKNLYRVRASRYLTTGSTDVTFVISFPNQDRYSERSTRIDTLVPYLTDESDSEGRDIYSDTLYHGYGSLPYSMNRKKRSFEAKTSIIPNHKGDIFIFHRSRNPEFFFDPVSGKPDQLSSQATGMQFRGTCDTDDGTGCVIDIPTLATYVKSAYDNYNNMGFTPKIESQFFVQVEGTPQFNNSNCLLKHAVAFYDPVRNKITLCSTRAGTLSTTLDAQKTIRHEMWHAVQKKLEAILTSSWLIEGQADSAVESTKIHMEAWEQNGPMPITKPLNAASTAYRTQYFWTYVGRTKGKGLNYIYDMTKSKYLNPWNDVDTAIKNIGYSGGLKKAYWDFVRNQAFEKEYKLRASDQGRDCTLDESVIYGAGNTSSSNVDYRVPGFTISSTTFPAMSGNAFLVKPLNIKNGSIWLRATSTIGIHYRVYRVNSANHFLDGDCTSASNIDLDEHGKLFENIQPDTKLLVIAANDQYSAPTSMGLELEKGIIAVTQFPDTTLDVGASITHNTEVRNYGRALGFYDTKVTNGDPSIATVVFTQNPKGEIPDGLTQNMGES
jgi:hypothetical protein